MSMFCAVGPYSPLVRGQVTNGFLRACTVRPSLRLTLAPGQALSPGALAARQGVLEHSLSVLPAAPHPSQIWIIGNNLGVSKLITFLIIVLSYCSTVYYSAYSFDKVSKYVSSDHVQNKVRDFASDHEDNRTLTSFVHEMTPVNTFAFSALCADRRHVYSSTMCLHSWNTSTSCKRCTQSHRVYGTAFWSFVTRASA